MNIDEIRAYKEKLVQLYSLTRANQTTDETYYKDTFPVEEIKTPHRIYRSGIGVRIVDSPAERIVTKNPQAFFTLRKGQKEAGLRISEMINQSWLDILRRQNPNIFKEHIKGQLGYGEAYFKIVHNDDWIDGSKSGLPVHFIVPNSMVVYASPEEDVHGRPKRVVVFYQRQPQEVIVKYPEWSNPKQRKLLEPGTMIEWMEYWDENVRYFEADGEPVLKGGVQPNIYGLVPFVRKFSGFGRRSPDGELASLIVSDIRYSRDLVREECAIRSNIASIEYLFAHKAKTLIAAGLDPDKIKEDISFGAYDLNYINADPTKVRIDEIDITPNADMFKHHSDIIAELNQRHPFIVSGFPWGSSGRQQDMTEIAAFRRYDSVVENTENALAVAIEMAWAICRKLDLKPDEIRQSDLETEFKCNVHLKAADELENDRRITLGEREYQAGTISIYTLHTQYMGMTEDEHKREMGRILADKVTFQNPEWAAMIGSAAAREGGMEMELEQVRERLKGMVTNEALSKTLPRTGRERMMGETETDMGREMGTVGGRGARVPPERFVRER